MKSYLPNTPTTTAEKQCANQGVHRHNTHQVMADDVVKITVWQALVDVYTLVKRFWH